MDRMLSSEEAAKRLGVKITTLYAYVSRGLVSSHPNPNGRSSLFDLDDIERLAQRSRGGRQSESRLATVTTSVTQLHQHGGPFYRGRAATELVATLHFEEVAALIWNQPPEDDWSPVALGPCPLVGTLDRMRWALVVCGANDPLRSDLRPEAVTRAARRVIASLTDVIATGPTGGDGDAAIAQRLAHRLGARDPVAVAEALDAALILMADHELATSTMAVRVATSVHTDIYDALLVGLATLAGPLHGGASQEAHELLVRAERDGVATALNEVLRQKRYLPGFGHAVYKSGDARHDALMRLVEPLLDPEQSDLVHEVIALAAEHRVPLPNCDLALAALSWGLGLPSDSGRTIFAIARVSGWTAHYLEELTEPPLRFRARAVYSV
ncbi:MAG TPA: citrate/2-methylcitrate synthase [Acidimicrobiales bacterium]|jgi:citrate synthase